MAANGLLNTEIVVEYIKGIFELLKQPLYSSVVESLPTALTTLILGGQSLGSPYHRNVLEQVNPLLKPLIEEFGTLPAFQSFLPCISRLLGSMIIYPELQPVIINHYMTLEKVVAGRFPKREIEPAAIPNTISSLKVLKEWFVLTMTMFIRAKQLNADTLIRFFLLSQNVAALSQQSIEYLAMVGKQQPDTLRSATEIEELDEVVNEVKARSLSLINNMLYYIYIKNITAEMVETPLFGLCKILILSAFVTLNKMCTAEHPLLLPLLEKPHVEEFTVGLLSVATTMVQLNVFYSVFAQIKEKLLVDIVLVLMASNVKEKCMMVADPGGFVSLALDICDKQESGTPKTEAAKLLHTICKHIDGCCTFVYMVCCQALSVYSTKSPAEQLKDFPILLQFASTSPFFTQTEPEYIVDTVLLALSVLSDIFASREDLRESFKGVLQDNIERLVTSSSSLVKSRTALLLGYCACDLFQKLPALLVKTIQFLTEGLIKEREDKAFSDQCAEALRNIMIDEDAIAELSTQINDLLLHFAAAVEIVSSSVFFEVLETVIKVYNNVIDQSIGKVTQALVKRIIKESESKKISIVISRCWNMIATICNTEGFFPYYSNELERDLAPTFNFIANPANIDFEEDLMKVIGLVIKRQQRLSENMIKLYPLLELVYEKGKRVLGNMLQLVNNYLIYGREEFSSGVLKVDLVLKMASFSLVGAPEVVEVNASKAAVLFQMALQSLGNGVLDSYLPGIILEVINYSNTKPMGPVLVIQIYNVLLSAICNNPLLSIKALEELGKTQEVLARILADYANFKLPYDRKVFVVSFATLLSLQTLSPSVASLMPKVLAVLVEILSAQAETESKVYYGKDSKLLLNNCDDDLPEYDELLAGLVKGEEKKELSDTESDDMENEVKSPLQIINDIVESMQSKLKKIDEYNYLSNAIKILNLNNPEALKVWISALDQNQQDALRQIIKSKRVVTHRQGERVLVARRIIKPKHKLDKNQ
eukprot:TRINITY_DN9585_c0_g2_i2.p1 TRINITY_DN9585_c0_g2~~TRINITY_DN9585_c0_g2_i2.p1  ORF type:complete len:992 (+),score=287.84 TRINITY_DN9585_c0_g2_i2:271-3246(+)